MRYIAYIAAWLAVALTIAFGAWPNSGRKYPIAGGGAISCTSTLANPSNLTASPWTTFGAPTVTYPSGTTSPDLTNDATRVTIGAGVPFAQVYQLGTFGPIGTATASVYAKAVTPGTNNKFRLALKNGGDVLSGDITATGAWIQYSFMSSAGGFTGVDAIYIDTAGDMADIYLWCANAP